MKSSAPYRARLKSHTCPATAKHPNLDTSFITACSEWGNICQEKKFYTMGTKRCMVQGMHVCPWRDFSEILTDKIPTERKCQSNIDVFFLMTSFTKAAPTQKVRRKISVKSL